MGAMAIAQDRATVMRPRGLQAGAPPMAGPRGKECEGRSALGAPDEDGEIADNDAPRYSLGVDPEPDDDTLAAAKALERAERALLDFNAV